MKTQGYLIRISCRSYTATTIMVLFSIVVAVFCLNVIAGYAETYYRSVADLNTYTTITIAGMDEETQNTDMLTELRQYGAVNVIYICRSRDGAILAGFDGTDSASQWWPHMAGDFVNSYHGEDFPKITYLTDFEAQNVPIGDMFDIDGSAFRVIGYGWIVPQSFTRVISRSSPQTVFDEFGSATYYDDTIEDISRAIRVIPYQAFRASYTADLILVRFSNRNYAQMLNITDQVAKTFPHSTVTPPTANSSEAFQRALQIMRHFIPLFLILTEITVVMAVCELYKKLQQGCYICRICGMSRAQVRMLLIGEVGLLYITGSIIAVLLQKALKEILIKLDAGELPTLLETAVTVIVLYAITVVCSLPVMNNILCIQNSKEE